MVAQPDAALDHRIKKACDMKFLQWYRLTPVYALFLTICTYLLVGTITAAPYEPGGVFRAMLKDRGSAPYFIVFLTFCTLTMAVLARIRGERRVTFMLGMYGLSSLSIIAGMLGTFAGFAHSLPYLTMASIMLKDASVEINEAGLNIQEAMQGITTAVDTTHLALLLTLISWAAVIWCCVSAPSTEHEDKGASS
jgi:uncharacterized membrane protein YhaH (DUF805 family)